MCALYTLSWTRNSVNLAVELLHTPVIHCQHGEVLQRKPEAELWENSMVYIPSHNGLLCTTGRTKTNCCKAMKDTAGYFPHVLIKLLNGVTRNLFNAVSCNSIHYRASPLPHCFYQIFSHDLYFQQVKIRLLPRQDFAGEQVSRIPFPVLFGNIEFQHISSPLPKTANKSKTKPTPPDITSLYQTVKDSIVKAEFQLAFDFRIGSAWLQLTISIT